MRSVCWVLILVFCGLFTLEVDVRVLLFLFIVDNQRQELHNLILNDFAYAWDCVRPSLANYGKYNTIISD